MARFMLQPADVLIVDEPTNDLDIPTREILEESFKEFSGALVLVTHDRFMLEKVCKEFVGLDGQGGHGHFATYGQWEKWLFRQSQGNAIEGVSSRSRKGTDQGPKPKNCRSRNSKNSMGWNNEFLRPRLFEIPVGPRWKTQRSHPTTFDFKKR